MNMLARTMAGTLGPLALAGAALPVSAQETPAPVAPALAVAAAPAAAGALPGSPQAADTQVIQLDRDARDRMTVPVHIGEVGPFAFMVDTGAQRTVLTRQTADRLGLVPNGSVRLVSVAGIQDVALVTVAELSMGSRRVSGLEAPLVDGEGLGAEGIVGLDGLKDQRVDIDFTRNRMVIGRAAPVEASADPFAIVVTARRRAGQLIMTEAVIDGVKVDVMIDTGADASIGNLALQRALDRHRGTEEARLVSVTGQAINAQVGRARAMRIGNLRIGNLSFAFADAPAFAYLKLNRRPALMLGMRDLSAFKRVAIDFARRKVMFDFTDRPETLAVR